MPEHEVRPSMHYFHSRQTDIEFPERDLVNGIVINKRP